MTEVNYVIEKGEAIPDDVIGMEGSRGSEWRLTSKGHWHLSTAQITCLHDDCGGDGYALMRAGDRPLTVTAVREPEPPQIEVVATTRVAGADVPIYAEVPERPVERAGWPEETDPPTTRTVRVTMGLNIEERDGKAVFSTGHLGEIGSCDRQAFLDLVAEEFGVVVTPQGAESQQPESGALLDLVRQYGDARESVGGYTPDIGTLQAFKANAAIKSAHELFDRIAALVPQQPVQARTEDRIPLWIHGCGSIWPTLKAEGSCDGCGMSGPWRPLLVGGDPAPERPAVVEAWKVALVERDEARAEVERLQSDNDRLKRVQKRTEAEDLQVIAERDDYHEWADRLAEAIAEHLHVDIGEHSNMNLPWQAALIALENAATSPASDPSVLSLPQVPPGTVALDGREHRWVRSYDGQWRLGAAGHGAPGLPLVEVLRIEGSVTVVKREPRTELPCGHLIENSKFDDEDGGKTLITIQPAHDSNGDPITTPLAWCAQGHGWLSLTADEFGELTEMFDDEPGGAS